MLAAAEALVALAAGFLFVGKKSLWFDEGWTASVVALDWGPFRELVFEQEGMHGFYYLLLRSWTNLGDSEVWLRAPSVLFATGTVWVLVLLGRELFGSRVALAAGLLLALNPFVIRYAQEARGPALAMFLTTLASYLFVRMTRDPRRRLGAAYVVVSALAAYAHMFAVLVTVTHVLSLIIARRSFEPLRALLPTGMAVVALLIPLGAFALTTSREQIAWVPPSDLLDLVRHFSRFAGGPWLLVPYALAAALPALEALGLRGTHRGILADWPLAMVLLWLAVPTGAVFVVSFWQPIFVSRYLIFSLPALVLLVAVGLAQIRPPMWSAIGFILLIVLSSWGLDSTYDREKEDWRGATEFISSAARPGDAIIFHHPEAQRSYHYYLERQAYPAHAPSWVEYGPLERDGAEAQVTRIMESLDQTPHDRVWLVLSHERLGVSEMLNDWISNSLGLIDEEQFAGGVRVLLYGAGGDGR